MALPLPLALLAYALGAGALALTLLNLRRLTRWSRTPVEPEGAWRPPVSVIVPARGEHHGFAEHVRALASQEYPDYELLFVVDGEEDPAARALRALEPELPRVRVRLVDPAEAQAGWATGKIAAQVSGVKAARPESGVLVFADADMQPGPRWLASLVAPLERPEVGGVTGTQAYWAAGRASFWTALRDAFVSLAWEAMLSEHRRFLWGGSMAVRRADFDRSAVLQEWRHHIADDQGLTRAIKALGLRIVFAPGAFTAGPEDWGREEVMAWVAKELALVRSVDPKAYRLLALIPLVSLGALLGGLALVATWPSLPSGIAGLLLLLPTFSAPLRAWLKWRLVRRAIPEARQVPARERAMQLLATWLLPWLMLAGMARSGRLRAIEWRGKAYEVERGGR